jgi:uncharacterized membrane protein YuzA (DUF378 family)
MQSKAFDITALTIVIIGAVNWGLVGFFNFNLVGLLTGGASSVIARVVYAVVGLAGLYMLTMYGKLDSANNNIKIR